MRGAISRTISHLLVTSRLKGNMSQAMQWLGARTAQLIQPAA